VRAGVELSQNRSVLQQRREQGRDRGREHADDDRVGAGGADRVNHGGHGLSPAQLHLDTSAPDNRNLAGVLRNVV